MCGDNCNGLIWILLLMVATTGTGVCNVEGLLPMLLAFYLLTNCTGIGLTRGTGTCGCCAG